MECDVMKDLTNSNHYGCFFANEGGSYNWPIAENIDLVEVKYVCCIKGAKKFATRVVLLTVIGRTCFLKANQIGVYVGLLTHHGFEANSCWVTSGALNLLRFKSAVQLRT